MPAASGPNAVPSESAITSATTDRALKASGRDDRQHEGERADDVSGKPVQQKAGAESAENGKYADERGDSCRRERRRTAVRQDRHEVNNRANGGEREQAAGQQQLVERR